ncbi:MAG TPA: hypothetical protein VK212_08170 [Lentimicrobium sp.]|nr:hypothetical protein [Lentimicrobium sp.]
MNYKTFILAAFCWLIFIPFAKSQVYDQAKLFKLLPEIPSNLLTATEEEVSAFRRSCDSIDEVLTGYQEKYKRTSDSETNSALIMEYYDIRDSILDLNSTQRSKYYDLVPLFSDLEFELSSKNDLIKESIENLKYEGNKVEEIKALNDQIYANRLECSQKQIALYLQYMRDYKTKLDQIAEKANKSESLPLPDHLNKNVSYVLMNVKNYLKYLSEAYQFNLDPDNLAE